MIFGLGLFDFDDRNWGIDEKKINSVDEVLSLGISDDAKLRLILQRGLLNEEQKHIFNAKCVEHMLQMKPEYEVYFNFVDLAEEQNKACQMVKKLDAPWAYLPGYDKALEKLYAIEAIQKCRLDEDASLCCACAVAELQNNFDSRREEERKYQLSILVG
jgi:hypothetical protein